MSKVRVIATYKVFDFIVMHVGVAASMVFYLLLPWIFADGVADLAKRFILGAAWPIGAALACVMLVIAVGEFLVKITNKLHAIIERDGRFYWVGMFNFSFSLSDISKIEYNSLTGFATFNMDGGIVKSVPIKHLNEEFDDIKTSIGVS